MRTAAFSVAPARLSTINSRLIAQGAYYTTLLPSTNYATTGFWVGFCVRMFCFCANGSGRGSSGKAKRAF